MYVKNTLQEVLHKYQTWLTKLKTIPFFFLTIIIRQPDVKDEYLNPTGFPQRASFISRLLISTVKNIHKRKLVLSED